MADEKPMRFCPICGNPVSPADVFCNSCGTNIPALSSPSPPPSEQRKRSRATIPIIVTVVLIVFMLFMLDVPQDLMSENGFTGIPSLSHNTYSTGNGTKSITWTYGSDTYTIKFTIPQTEYTSYANEPIQRGMTSTYDYSLGLQFVTANDSLIKAIATQLVSLKDQAGLTSSEEANMVLAFVQTIPYKFDNVTYHQEEYWAFPVETLYHGQGDCEDKSFLFTSIMENLNYSCALLFFSDHVAVGVAFNSLTGGTYYTVGGIHYYYCETTNVGWVAGEKPEDYGSSHVVVV